MQLLSLYRSLIRPGMYGCHEWGGSTFIDTPGQGRIKGLLLYHQLSSPKPFITTSFSSLLFYTPMYGLLPLLRASYNIHLAAQVLPQLLKAKVNWYSHSSISTSSQHHNIPSSTFSPYIKIYSFQCSVFRYSYIILNLTNFLYHS